MAGGVCRRGAEDDNKPKRKEEKNLKKLHSEELHNFYFSQKIIMTFNSRIDGAYGMDVREGNFMQKSGRKTSKKAST